MFPLGFLFSLALLFEFSLSICVYLYTCQVSLCLHTHTLSRLVPEFRLFDHAQHPSTLPNFPWHFSLPISLSNCIRSEVVLLFFNIININVRLNTHRVLKVICARYLKLFPQLYNSVSKNKQFVPELLTNYIPLFIIYSCRKVNIWNKVAVLVQETYVHNALTRQQHLLQNENNITYSYWEPAIFFIQRRILESAGVTTIGNIWTDKKKNITYT